ARVCARTEPTEEIDLTCLPLLPFDFGPQSTEPPLADHSAAGGRLRPVSYEQPADATDGPVLPPPPATLPLLKDDADAPPAKLPKIDDDGPVLPPPCPDAKPAGNAVPSGPLFEA